MSPMSAFIDFACVAALIVLFAAAFAYAIE